MQVPSLRVTSCELRDASYELRVANCLFEICEVQVSYIKSDRRNRMYKKTEGSQQSVIYLFQGNEKYTNKDNTSRSWSIETRSASVSFGGAFSFSCLAIFRSCSCLCSAAVNCSGLTMWTGEPSRGECVKTKTRIIMVNGNHNRSHSTRVKMNNQFALRGYSHHPLIRTSGLRTWGWKLANKAAYIQDPIQPDI